MRSIINRRGSKAATRALKRLGNPQKVVSKAKPIKTTDNTSAQQLPHKKELF